MSILNGNIISIIIVNILIKKLFGSDFKKNKSIYKRFS